MGLIAEPENFSELFINQMFLELLLISKEKLGKIPLLFFYSYPANKTTGGSCFASLCPCPLWELILAIGSLDPKVRCVPLSLPCARSTHILFYSRQWRDGSCQMPCSSGYLSDSGYLLVLPIPDTFWDLHTSTCFHSLWCVVEDRDQCHSVPFLPSSLDTITFDTNPFCLLQPNLQLPCCTDQGTLCPDGLSSIRMPAHTCPAHTQK